VKDRLTTARLDLRVFVPDDDQALHALFSDPKTHTIGSGPITDLTQTQTWIANRDAAFQRFGLAWYAVRLQGSESLIGNCGMLRGRKTSEQPEIGYEIAASQRGHGYATEAATAVVAECTREGLRTIWATVRPNNVPSIRIVESLDFILAFSDVDDKGPLLHYSKSLNA